MADYLKPQSPLQHKDGNYFYPLTTIDQIITDNDTRLNAELINVDFSNAVDNNGEMTITNANMLNGKTIEEIFNEIINYSIVNSVTESSNPTENMIWIETNVEITKHIFSKNEPKNPIEGMVWIYLSDNSNVSFHTLNINGREFDEVYPISAQQYVGGIWVDKTAKIYQGGEWIEWWTGYIYVNGKFKHISGFTPTSATVSNSGAILTIETQGNVFSCAYSNEAVDLTGVSEIDVYFEEGSKSYNDINQGVCISDSHLAVNTKGNLAFSQYPSESFSGKVTVNVETINREAYIGFTLGGRSSFNGILKISKIEMRRE